MTHLIAIAIIALVCRGIAFVLSDGQVLGWLGNLLRKLPSWIHKPLGTCGNCSVWLWGTLTLYALGMLPDPLWWLVFYWLGAAGVQDLLDP